MMDVDAARIRATGRSGGLREQPGSRREGAHASGGKSLQKIAARRAVRPSALVHAIPPETKH
jgi:hypothetical protein